MMEKKRKAIEKRWPPEKSRLSSDTQSFDDVAITVNIFFLQIVKKASSLTNHLQQAAAAMMVFFMFLQMFIQIVDFVGQNRDLNFRRTGVAFMSFEFVDQFSFRCFV